MNQQAPVEPLRDAEYKRMREMFETNNWREMCLRDYKLMLDEIARLRSLAFGPPQSLVDRVWEENMEKKQ